MKVLKFGGSSVADPDRIRAAARIVARAARRERVVVVVSAFQGITNQLLHCARIAEKGGIGYQTFYGQIAQRHRETFNALLKKTNRASTLADLRALLEELHDVLHGISLLRDCSPRALNLTASFGERFSALIIATYLRQAHSACSVDARKFIVTDDQFTRPQERGEAITSSRSRRTVMLERHWWYRARALEQT